MRVVVAGGGLGGLLLSKCLADAGMQVVVLERDDTPSALTWAVGIAGFALLSLLRCVLVPAARAQGYYISLNNTGIQAIACAGLTQQLQAVAEPPRSGHHFTFLQPDGGVLADLVAPPNSRNARRRTLPCSRSALRAMLLAGALDAGVDVRFGTSVAAVEWDARVHVTTACGDTVAGDVCVGADGVRSAVRAAWLGDPLTRVGVTVIGGRVPGTTVPRELFSGDAMVLGRRGVSLFLGRFTPPGADAVALSWGLGVSHTSPLHAEVLADADADADGGPAVGAIASSLAADGWHPDLLAVLAQAPSVNVRPLWDRPPLTASRGALPWPTHSRVALLGDAAHPMTPYQGLGANTAFADAVALSTQLAACGASPADVPAAVDRFHVDMFKRSAPAVAASRRACAGVHATSWPATAARDTVLKGMGALLRLASRRG